MKEAPEKVAGDFHQDVVVRLPPDDDIDVRVRKGGGNGWRGTTDVDAGRAVVDTDVREVVVGEASSPDAVR